MTGADGIYDHKELTARIVPGLSLVQDLVQSLS